MAVSTPIPASAAPRARVEIRPPPLAEAHISTRAHKEKASHGST